MSILVQCCKEFDDKKLGFGAPIEHQQTLKALHKYTRPASDRGDASPRRGAVKEGEIPSYYSVAIDESSGKSHH